MWEGIFVLYPLLIWKHWNRMQFAFVSVFGSNWEILYLVVFGSIHILKLFQSMHLLFICARNVFNLYCICICICICILLGPLLKRKASCLHCWLLLQARNQFLFLQLSLEIVILIVRKGFFFCKIQYWTFSKGVAKQLQIVSNLTSPTYSDKKGKYSTNISRQIWWVCFCVFFSCVLWQREYIQECGNMALSTNITAQGPSAQAPAKTDNAGIFNFNLKSLN